ncbi:MULTISPECIES: SPOR domain-containing protein [unclassified Prevotella]|uniref:SPOR domain-containing protein n=1 Tax=unclassified Prevotella TaxID=2638335 RepID=UPI0008E66E42|nr:MULTISPECIES: SPOR domain-containing protein [unclassified Prevotella]PTL32912.1 SPOR domain-containing protein [Prevotella sp. oral taxon 376]SFG20814.1 Sporulation related domain-containing protein [Prevotella sp. KH2C16]
MKKSLAMCAGFCVALVLASCGSSKESAYKKAYEKAKAQEQVAQDQQPVTQAPVVAPIVQQPATQTTVVDNVDNATVRTEDVTLVSGAGLQSYSVVVGSFSLKANAEGLQNTLKSAGYDAQIAYNSARNMYRVVASTHSDKASAVASRNQFRGGNYPDAWLLYKK